jgi:hypothetical protein
MPAPGHQEYFLVTPGQVLCYTIPATFGGQTIKGGNAQLGSVPNSTTLGTLFEASVSNTPGDFHFPCGYGWGGGSAPVTVNWLNSSCLAGNLYLNYRVVPGNEGHCTEGGGGRCGQVLSLSYTY